MASLHSFQSFTLGKNFFLGLELLTPAPYTDLLILIQKFEALDSNRMKTYKYPGNTQTMTLELQRYYQAREQHESTTHLQGFIFLPYKGLLIKLFVIQETQ